MPLASLPLLGLLAGLVFASAAGESRGHPAILARALVLGAAFGLLLLGPCAAFLVAIAPDWSLAYLVDSRRVPSLAFMLWVLGVTACVPLGTWLGSSAPVLRRRQLVLQGVAVLIVAVVAVVAASLPRLAVLATFAQYHGKFGVRPLAGSPLGYGLVWLSALLVGGAAFTFRAIVKRAAS